MEEVLEQVPTSLYNHSGFLVEGDVICKEVELLDLKVDH